MFFVWEMGAILIFAGFIVQPHMSASTLCLSRSGSAPGAKRRRSFSKSADVVSSLSHIQNKGFFSGTVPIDSWGFMLAVLCVFHNFFRRTSDRRLKLWKVSLFCYCPAQVSVWRCEEAEGVLKVLTLMALSWVLFFFVLGGEHLTVSLVLAY